MLSPHAVGEAVRHHFLGWGSSQGRYRSREGSAPNPGPDRRDAASRNQFNCLPADLFGILLNNRSSWPEAKSTIMNSCDESVRVTVSKRAASLIEGLWMGTRSALR